MEFPEMCQTPGCKNTSFIKCSMSTDYNLYVEGIIPETCLTAYLCEKHSKIFERMTKIIRMEANSIREKREKISDLETNIKDTVEVTKFLFPPSE